MNELYFSTDVESDGPIPGPNSMLSLGSAAFNSDGEMLGSFSANLEFLPGASADPSTKAFWDQNPEAWKAARENPEDPATAIPRFAKWVEGFKKKPIFVAYPAGYDFTFVYWYLMKFNKNSPFGFSALDIKSYASALLKLPFRDTVKSKFPGEWFSKSPHTHVAVQDAIEQGELFINMLKSNK